MSEMNSSLTYRQNGDYLIPNLELREEATKPLTKYGRMRKKFLQENRSVLYNHLILSGKLQSHLVETQENAQAMVDQIVSSLAKENSVNEEMKARNQMQWLGLMNSLKAQAEETVLTELVYA